MKRWLNKLFVWLALKTSSHGLAIAPAYELTRRDLAHESELAVSDMIRAHDTRINELTDVVANAITGVSNATVDNRLTELNARQDVITAALQQTFQILDRRFGEIELRLQSIQLTGHSPNLAPNGLPMSSGMASQTSIVTQNSRAPVLTTAQIDEVMRQFPNGVATGRGDNVALPRPLRITENELQRMRDDAREMSAEVEYGQVLRRQVGMLQQANNSSQPSQQTRFMAALQASVTSIPTVPAPISVTRVETETRPDNKERRLDPEL